MTVDTVDLHRANLITIAAMAEKAAQCDAEALRQSVLAIELRQGIAIIERAFGAEPRPETAEQSPSANAPIPGAPFIASFAGKEEGQQPIQPETAVQSAEPEKASAEDGRDVDAAGRAAPVLTHSIPASPEPPSTPLAETGEGVRPYALPDTSAGPTFTSPDAPFRDPTDIEDEDGARPVSASPDDLTRRKRAYQRVKSALEAHPSWTIREIAEYAGCSVGHAGRWIKSLRGPVRPSGQETLGAKLALLVADRGQVTIREAIEAIGGTPGGIAAAARRAGIELRKVSKEEHAENVKAGMAKSSAPPPKENISPPESDRVVPKNEPVVVPEPVVEAQPPARAKQSMSLRFYLRDELGRYLHQSLERSPTDTGPLMTSNRKWAWFDNERRYEGALRKWPVIAVLRREAPQ